MAVNEEVYYEGGPHIGDLIIGILLIFTLIALPVSVGAIVRALWLRFRITNRRVSVTGGWMGRDRTDVIYKEIVKVVSVPRGIGLWGDMVLTLKDGSRVELRAIPRFRDMEAYILQQAKLQPASAAN